MTQTEAVSETALRITRKLAAPRELVFKAWTEPEVLAKWWGVQADYSALPDSQAFIEAIQTTFQELRNLTSASG